MNIRRLCNRLLCRLGRHRWCIDHDSVVAMPTARRRTDYVALYVCLWCGVEQIRRVPQERRP